MNNPFNHPAMVDISLLTSRLTLGLYMLLTGWTKINGPGLSGFVDKSFMAMKPDWLPDVVARPYGYALPVLELLTGVLIVLGLFTRWAGGIMALMLLSIFIAAVSAQGITGGQSGGAFHYSIILASFAFVLAIVGPGRLALDPLYFGGGGPGGRGK
ncbi:MAG TPA: DoxX family protein [Tepidisphaeraceae bacterium]|jgi:uncharacterized membrane protein YphA (DoxX/SURF4 family)